MSVLSFTSVLSVLPMTTVTILTAMTNDHHDYDDHHNVIMTLRKLEVERKEVGGCLVSYNLQLAYSRKLEVI